MKRNHFVFCGVFYGNVDLSDQFEECLWFACSTFYRKCVMQCGTRTGLVLVLTRSRPALVLVLTRSRPALVLVLTWSRPLKVLVLSRSRYTLVLVMTWSRFRWSWLQHWCVPLWLNCSVSPCWVTACWKVGFEVFMLATLFGTRQQVSRVLVAEVLYYGPISKNFLIIRTVTLQMCSAFPHCI